MGLDRLACGQQKNDQLFVAEKLCPCLLHSIVIRTYILKGEDRSQAQIVRGLVRNERGMPVGVTMGGGRISSHQTRTRIAQNFPKIGYQNSQQLYEILLVLCMSSVVR